jgi:hypothetical protein
MWRRAAAEPFTMYARFRELARLVELLRLVELERFGLRAVRRRRADPPRPWPEKSAACAAIVFAWAPRNPPGGIIRCIPTSTGRAGPVRWRS